MVQEQVLARIAAERDFKVHIVWTPVLPSDDRASAVEAQAIFSDPRATHYWDADRSLGLAYAEVVQLPQGNDTLAWDIYFTYEPGSHWSGDPPAPAAWWHQLGFDDRYLATGEGLREQLLRLSH